MIWSFCFLAFFIVILGININFPAINILSSSQIRKEYTRQTTKQISTAMKTELLLWVLNIPIGGKKHHKCYILAQSYFFRTYYLLSLKPLLELHTELLWCIASRSHNICSGMHGLHWKIVLLVHLSHHRVKGCLLALNAATKTTGHSCSWPMVGLAIYWRLLINHDCRILAMKCFMFGFQSLSLQKNRELNSLSAIIYYVY